ncbi:hypothetical protein GCM10009799_34430 [Nocardiopsis rhodophaea]|uniref:Fumarylacetoacetase-like C-terminal domain-containing protein n=1 Tax=Nocardiopsis rhodophaea TaxID=280238 RepID=A0ABN2TBQ7_9ACTN
MDSGTCGCLAELWGRRARQDPPPLQLGDTVTLTAEGIGTIATTVVAGPAPVPLPSARRRGSPIRSGARPRAVGDGQRPNNYAQ